MTDSEEHIIDSDHHRFFNGIELWRYRELFYFFAWRDIKIKYKQTMFGFLWAILQPLLMMVIFTLFFGRALNVPSQNIPYPVFVFSGLLVWNMFSTGLANSANSMVNNSTIIKKIYFPRLIIPASSILVALFDFLMAFVLFIPLLIFYQQPLSWRALWCWPLSLALSVIATFGPGCLLAALNVKYRDFRYVIPFVIQVLFFLTPVIYPVSMLNHPFLQYILVLSPMYAAVELFRLPLISAEINSTFLLLSLTSSSLFLLLGIFYFRRTEDFFADFA
ncbi:MAG: ABC transporter permease [Bacteroidota bacterium]